MRWTLLLIVTACLQLLEASLLHFVQIGGRAPDLLLVLVAFVAANCVPFDAALGGAAIGCVRDVFGAGRLGLSTLLFMVVALIFSAFFKGVVKTRRLNNPLTQGAWVFAASLFCYVLYLAYTGLCYAFEPEAALLLTAALVSLYNALIAPIVFLFLLRTRLTWR